MSTKTVTLTYGTETISLQVPEGFLAGDVIRPRSMPPMPEAEILGRMRKALERPLGRPPLRELVGDQRVAVVLSDEFRAGLHEQIIEALCAELARGGPEEVVFLCATGTHDPGVYARCIGEKVARHASARGLRHRFVGHDCDDPELVPVGRTPLGTAIAIERDYLRADVRVYGHEAKHHYMHGYSLVDKQIVPGITGRRTVEMNHKRSLSPDSGPGRCPWHDDPERKDNPFCIDSRDARHIVEGLWLDDAGSLQQRDDLATFALDMISDRDSVYWVAAGDPDEICRRAVRKADEQAQFTVDRTRYLVISPGGPPASQAMYGVQNCFDMAMKGAVEPGGEVLVVAPCEGRPDLPEDVRGVATHAASKRLFWDNLVRMRDWELDACREWIDANFELYLWKTWRVLRNFKADRVQIHVHCQLPPERLEAGGFHHVADPQAWIDERAARGDGKLRAVDNGNKMLIVGR